MKALASLTALRRAAVGRSLFNPTTLSKALARLGFVQADPIRAPARAQDLTLRHRVINYRAGDLEAKYSKLGVEEDFFVNYGFVTPPLQQLMHPRAVRSGRTALVKRHGPAVLAFIAERGEVHPRDVDQHFAHGSTKNAWGGQSNLTTHLLDGMHYRGLLRVARRDNGIRLYALPQRTFDVRSAVGADFAFDAMIDVLVNKYAPLPQPSMGSLLRRLCYASPQWRGRLGAAIARAKTRLAHATIEGVTWYWPDGARPRGETDDEVRLLTPFDPVVWDRKRFEMLWGWAYRFEAYTPAPKRKLGYYALPMLWLDHVIGWANVSIQDGGLRVQTGYATGAPPKDRKFKRALDEECYRMSAFLGLPTKS